MWAFFVVNGVGFIGQTKTQPKEAHVSKLRNLLKPEYIVSGMVAIVAMRLVDRYAGGLLAKIGL